MAFGSRIKSLRESRGMTQTALCERVNALPAPIGGALNGNGEPRELSQQSLQMLEKRDSEVSIFALRLAEVLGVSPRWLLDGLGPQVAPEWPFQTVTREQVDALGPNEMAYVEGALRTAIDQASHLVEGQRAIEQGALDAKQEAKRQRSAKGSLDAGSIQKTTRPRS